MSETYGVKDVSRLFEISESRLRYWDRSAFLSPSAYEGRRRVYTFQDLIAVRSAKTLLDSGLSLQRARRILCSLRDKLPRATSPLSKLRIISDSKTVVVMDEDGHFEADSGQLLLDLSVRALEQEVIAELPRNGSGRDRSAYEWYLEGCRLDEDESTLADAESAYYKAIHLDPTLSNAYTNLGNLLYRTGSSQDARVLYEKAIEIDPNQPEAHYNLGFLLFEEGRLPLARDHFDRAVSLDSTFADAHFNLAMAELRLGGSDKAKGHLHNYLAIEPSGPWADLARARLEALSE
jgi:tetratricopeptide (TPR) repeat protein